MRLPQDANEWWVFDPAMDREQYVRQTLEEYRTTLNVCGRVRRTDHDLAVNLYQKAVPLTAIEGAFILATARRTSRHPTRAPLAPIGSLRYFLPIIREILDTPVDPGDISYLWWKMQGRL
ncbi:MAG: hypothetical protein GY769_04100 [bacterium]|nr:hypothetical protein [bacterium]